MRKAIMAVMLLAGLASSATVSAQTDSTMDKLIEDIRTDVKREKVAIVGDAMGFTADQAAKFWPIYKEYEAESGKVGDTLLVLIKDYAANYEKMTDQKAAQLASKMLQFQQQRLDLRKKYYDRLAKQISPVIAARFLQVDNRISLLIDLELASQIPLVE